ncbi:SAM-dependent methyltransferase [Cryobacterium melibiosiphilum]|uniref:SAM-dependent methyltransferase n=1 Tax=Cryobacterium melibiosiphilum TaxID=995039 RepID=A0A3A5MMT2_9MICO|nr:N-6 DNA methylase [Cryobacterium melibiosiphilum]RJT90351.1 SAM-dependent methyltransferase [Cryobacterium melibiosiphilum]
MTLAPLHPADTPELRKARGAFFTPQPIVRFIADWALRDAADAVFEPSAGDAEFLVEAVRRLRELSDNPTFKPTVHGVEIHKHSAQVGRSRVREAGGRPRIQVNDFFMVNSEKKYAAVIGNPPFVRYQDWSGVSRLRSREAALRAGVSLTGLASSWAAFVIQGSSILRDGGRLGLVLPAELLSVNYAAPVRQFLFDHFRSLEIVLFEEQVFPEAEADVVLLLADGYNQGPTDHATIRQAKNAAGLTVLENGMQWAPIDPAGKWTGAGLVPPAATMPLARLVDGESFVDLESWGDTTLGMVTGNNRYFALSPARIKELGIHRNELLRLSPPGSSHLRGLVLSDDMLTRLGRDGKATRLFYPAAMPSAAAQSYIDAGHAAGVDQAYKCQVRKTWYRVPLVAPADLLLTCMNADTPRLTTNLAGVRHLNSIHGVYLKKDLRDLGRELLPLASLNSITLLNAEMVGRAYGGGILKLEPKEADQWMMPAPELVRTRAAALRAIRDRVARKLQAGQLLAAVRLVDQALLLEAGHLAVEEIEHVRAAHAELTRRRTTRGKRG